jgi:hypothetical protein
MLQPKACGPRWFGDQLRSRSSSLSWRRLRPWSSWWRERFSRLLSTLSACYRASMVFRASQLGPIQHLTADVAAPTPSPNLWCWKGGGLGPWADGAPARPCYERWHEAELSPCCAATASSSAFNCWRTCHSSEVAGCSSKVSRCPLEEWRSINVSVRSLIGASVVVGLWPALRQRRCVAMRLVRGRAALAPVAIPLAGLPCTGTSYAGCRSRGSTSTPSSWRRGASSSTSWRLASASSSSRARC